VRGHLESGKVARSRTFVIAREALSSGGTKLIGDTRLFTIELQAG
jgi:hypothetical protein